MANLIDNQLREKIQSVAARFHEPGGGLMEAFYLVQDHLGFVSNDVIPELAEILKIAPARVYGALDFYSFYKLPHHGKFHIQCCGTISCELNGCLEVIEAAQKELGIKVGQTTKDKRFSLAQVECLGGCDRGPVVMVNFETYYRVTPEKMIEIIRELKARD